MKREENIKGIVIGFYEEKGYGWIRAEGVEQDVFVHYSAICGDGFKVLKEKEQVTFELVEGPKGPLASNVNVIKEGE